MSVTKEEIVKYAIAGALSKRSELQASLVEVNDLIDRLLADVVKPVVPGQEPVVDKHAAQPPAAKPDHDSSAARAERIARSWSPKARKAVSDRMKRYWAKRRGKAARAKK